MKLIVYELTGAGLSQELIAEKDMLLEAVRPHIYRHNWPTGTLKVQVLDASDNVLAESDPVNISDIGTQNFFHGYVRFYVNAGLKKNQTYKFKVVGGSGYGFSESAYIGFCTDYDLRKYEAQNSPSQGVYSAFDLEVWTRSTH